MGLLLPIGVAQPWVGLQFFVKRAQRMPVWIEPLICVPWFERISDVGETGTSKLRIITQEHRSESGMVDPIQSLCCISLFVIVIRIKAIGLQPPSRVEDKNLKHILAKSKT